MKLKNLRDVLIHQIKDIYFAEKQLVKALPKMERAASDADLKEAFAAHGQETQNHVSRLEEVFSLLGIPAKGEKCPAILGLIEEASETITEDHEPEAGDAAIIAAAQRVEHYEIAAYGCARAFAKRLGLDEVVTLLTATIEEEGAADQGLTRLAEGGINDSAVTGDDDQSSESSDESSSDSQNDSQNESKSSRSRPARAGSANSIRETKPAARGSNNNSNNNNGRAPAKADRQTSSRGTGSNGRSTSRAGSQSQSLANGKPANQRSTAATHANGKNGGRRKAAGSNRSHLSHSAMN